MIDWIHIDSGKPDIDRLILVKLLWDDVPFVARYTKWGFRAEYDHLKVNTGRYGNGGCIEHDFNENDIVQWAYI